MTTNERLALWAGWREVAVTHLGKPIGNWVDSNRISHWGVPAYDTSIDLIRRDLLPKLTREQWAKLSHYLFYTRWMAKEEPRFAEWLLTLPPAELAQAIAEVVDA